MLEIVSEWQSNLDIVSQEITENGLTLPTFGSYSSVDRNVYLIHFSMF